MERPRVESRLVITCVAPRDAEALATLLAGIDTTFFQPHPMTLAGAERIASEAGHNVYLMGWVDGDPVAYGMLRGWDEGYPIPSLGVAVRRDRLGRGFGRAMMLALHDIAKRVGAPRVRLRVHRDNVAALSLYRSLGYREKGVERGEVVMIVDLDAE